MKRYYHVYDLTASTPMITIGDKNPEYSEPSKNDDHNDIKKDEDDEMNEDIYLTSVIMAATVLLGLTIVALCKCYYRKANKQNVPHVLPMDAPNVHANNSLKEGAKNDSLLSEEGNERFESFL